MLTPLQVARIQESWRKVQPIADTSVELFHSRLLVLNPAFRPLLRKDLKSQGRRRVAILDAIVQGLESLERVAPQVDQLGGCAADPRVVEALLWTLKQGLGEAFDELTELAWEAACRAIARQAAIKRAA
jgi:hypothetical protein